MILDETSYEEREIQGKQCPLCSSKKIAKSFIGEPLWGVCLECRNIFNPDEKKETEI